jgi:hypothetical protein
MLPQMILTFRSSDEQFGSNPAGLFPIDKRLCGQQPSSFKDGRQSGKRSRQVCYPFLNGVTDRCQFWCQFVLEFRVLPCAGVHEDCV